MSRKFPDTDEKKLFDRAARSPRVPPHPNGLTIPRRITGMWPNLTTFEVAKHSFPTK